MIILTQINSVDASITQDHTEAATVSHTGIVTLLVDRGNTCAVRNITSHLSNASIFPFLFA
jgi:hypothetical protein